MNRISARNPLIRRHFKGLDLATGAAPPRAVLRRAALC